MISPKLYETLDTEERKLWHSHVFEVKSGMLIMPQPSVMVPQAAWEKAETAEMEDVVELYGKVGRMSGPEPSSPPLTPAKVYHLWQVDKGHKIPLGEPKLMTSFSEYLSVHLDSLGKLRRQPEQPCVQIASGSAASSCYMIVYGQHDAAL